MSLTLAVAATYFVAGKLGLRLAIVNSSATAVWPPTGIALAAVIFFGGRAGLGVFIGALATNLANAAAVPVAIGIAAGNTIEALLGGLLTQHFARGRRALEHPAGVFHFVLGGALLATMTSATIGVLTLCISQSAPWQAFGSIWLTWWIGDAMGALLFAPFLLAWNAGDRVAWTSAKIAEGIALSACLMTAGLLMAGYLFETRLGNAPFGFVTVPCLLWAAFRFSSREAFLGAFMLFAINLAGTLAGHGQFARQSANESLLLLQGFSGFVTLMTLFVAAVVTERTRAERSLRQINSELEQRVALRTAELRTSKQELDHFFTLSLDMLCIASTDGYFKRLSPAFESILGYTLDEMLMTPFIDFVHPDDVSATMSEVMKLAHGVPTIHFENRYRTKSGDYKWLAWTSQPAPDGTLYATARDITPQKRAEEELLMRAKELARSNAELEQFAYVASHDLQEPLRMVSSYMQLLSRRYQGKLDEQADKFIHHAMVGAMRMQALIRDLLTYARVGQGGKFEPVECEILLGHVLEDLSEAISANQGIVTHDPLPSLTGNAVQLGQLFQNLIANALKFRGEESPRVHVSAERRNGGWLFCVKDNGIGIAEEHRERVFKIFQRLHGRDEYSGTGIGLALCRKVVELHGGRIWLEPAPGKGTLFQFTIPEART